MDVARGHQVLPACEGLVNGRCFDEITAASGNLGNRAVSICHTAELADWYSAWAFVLEEALWSSENESATAERFKDVQIQTAEECLNGFEVDPFPMIVVMECVAARYGPFLVEEMRLAHGWIETLLQGKRLIAPAEWRGLVAGKALCASKMVSANRDTARSAAQVLQNFQQECGCREGEVYALRRPDGGYLKFDSALNPTVYLPGGGVVQYRSLSNGEYARTRTAYPVVNGAQDYRAPVNFSVDPDEDGGLTFGSSTYKPGCVPRAQNAPLPQSLPGPQTGE